MEQTFLDDQQSNRLRRPLTIGKTVFDYTITVAQAAAGLADVPFSTAARDFSLKSTKRIRREYAEHYIPFYSDVSGIAEGAFRTWVYEGLCLDKRILELSASGVFGLTKADMDKWQRRMKVLMEDANSTAVIARIPTAIMTPRAPRRALLKALIGAERTSRHLLRVATAYAGKLYTNAAGGVKICKSVPVHILSRHGFEEVVKALPTDTHREELIDEMIGRHTGGGVQLTYIDDRPGQKGHHLAHEIQRFDLRGVADDHVSLRRTRGKVLRFVYEATESVAQRQVVDEDRQLIQAALDVAELEWTEVMKWLVALTPDGCWLRHQAARAGMVAAIGN